jgi:transcription termination/antitermination protein NusG
MGELQWYVLKAVSGQEKKTKGYIENEIVRKKLQDYLPQILIPAEKVIEVRNGKKYNRERNFFPGYILIEADLTRLEVGPIVLAIPGVLGFLSADGAGANKTPTALRVSEVNRILGRIDEEEEKVATIGSTFMVNEHVRVIDGAFNGFDGIVEEVFEDRKKLNVSVKIFGRSTPVELMYTQVEKFA